MKNHTPRPILRSIALAIVMSFCLHSGLAATKTWSGGGADSNWNTGANWGGTAPVSNDSLIFNGTTQQNTTNDIVNLNVGFVTFSNGGFVLNGNIFTNSGTAPTFFTNAAGINTIACPLVTGSGVNG